MTRNHPTGLTIIEIDTQWVVEEGQCYYETIATFKKKEDAIEYALSRREKGYHPRIVEQLIP